MKYFQRTPSECLQEECSLLCVDILGEKYSKVHIKNLEMNEDVSSSVTHVECELFVGGAAFTINGSGRGIIDALYNVITSALNSKYVSLENIYLLDFSISADFDSPKKRSRTDAKVEARIIVSNESNRSFLFRHKAESMNAAVIVCITKIMEYFINSEETVSVLYGLIKDAKKRGREDLSQKYVYALSELVKNVSYESKIKNLSEVDMNCKKGM